MGFHPDIKRVYVVFLNQNVILEGVLFLVFTELSHIWASFH